MLTFGQLRETIDLFPGGNIKETALRVKSCNLAKEKILSIIRKKYKVYRVFIDMEKDRDLAERLDRLSRPLQDVYIRIALHKYMESGEWISQPLRQKREKEDLKQNSKPFLLDERGYPWIF